MQPVSQSGCPPPHQPIYSLCGYCKNIRLSRMILCLLIVMVTIPLVSHYYLSSFYQKETLARQEVYHSRAKLDHDDDSAESDRADHHLDSHVDELKRIKASVNNELRDLENKRQKLQSELSVYTSHVTSLKADFDHLTRALSQLKVSIEQAMLQRDELAIKHMPIITAPARIVPGLEQNIHLDMPSLALSLQCRMHTSFDYSRCSLLSGFPVYFYTPSDLTISQKAIIVEQFIENSVTHAFHSSEYITHKAETACIYVVLIGEAQLLPGAQTMNKPLLESILPRLPYWHGDGRNHILLNLDRNPALSNGDMFRDINTGRAMLAQSTFTQASFRPNFDIVVTPSLGKSDGDVWKGLPPLSPIRRKYMLSYSGEYQSGYSVNNVHEQQSSKGSASASPAPYEGSDDVISVLKRMQTLAPDQFMFSFSCSADEDRVLPVYPMDWALCGSDLNREDLLKQSTFSLIIAASNFSLVSSSILLTRLYEALKFGAIPIVLGSHVQLPFSETLHWHKSLIILPTARLTEMHFYLNTVTDVDIADLRRHGRIIWETFFGSTRKIIDTLLLTVRRRVGIPAAAMGAEPQLSIFNETFKQNTQVVSQIDSEMGDEILGPLEPSFSSPMFHHNFTSVQLNDYLLRPGDPFHMYPSMPFDPLLPSEAKFLGSSFGFRPVNRGEGGAGKEFSESLGGNVAREQFTIVLLTYKREAVLMNALQRLKGLPYLNRVLVVWNSPDLPYPELRWPEIGVPVDIVRTERNSLNNRFLPYEGIETDAILSLDDDAHLRHDEIIFGFRVWRQERDNIVGFPARYHAWDLTHHTWLYNSNYSCELSMVLTGAAFFHKYYAYLYSYVMPQAIRDKVDEYLNCEDIALNFLVAHITRKPPIKVTSRWTFRCPGCEEALSSDDSHFQERHKCISFFVQVYGYMPLLYTQYRVDSVLFKTRISHDKQKCFKFI